MSLYNALFQHQPFAHVVPVLLHLNTESIPRSRDAWVENHPEHEFQLVILTRTGGGNRAEYVEGNGMMASHPLYLRDEDDPFDSTYAKFYFKCPPEALGVAKEIIQRQSPNPGDLKSRFEEVLDLIKRR